MRSDPHQLASNPDSVCVPHLGIPLSLSILCDPQTGNFKSKLQQGCGGDLCPRKDLPYYLHTLLQKDKSAGGRRTSPGLQGWVLVSAFLMGGLAKP